MRIFEYVITEPVGIHARPASMLVKSASAYESTITIARDGKMADAKRLMALMALGIKCEEKVIFKVEGIDEDIAATELEAFCKENL